MFCNRCGNKMGDNAVFCGNCGNKIALGGSEKQAPGTAATRNSNDRQPTCLPPVKTKKKASSLIKGAVVVTLLVAVVMVGGFFILQKGLSGTYVREEKVHLWGISDEMPVRTELTFRSDKLLITRDNGLREKNGIVTVDGCTYKVVNERIHVVNRRLPNRPAHCSGDGNSGAGFAGTSSAEYPIKPYTIEYTYVFNTSKDNITLYNDGRFVRSAPFQQSGKSIFFDGKELVKK